MITVHLVLNAHIDPVWLWPWPAGMDEVIATCRSACDRLDANPDIVFTRGEAWAYDVVERADPALFARIAAHVAAGRWEIVGGWWVQPDCNLPSALGMQRQIGAGRRWFEARFGQFPRVAYNVDSFGHAAALPDLMRRNGQDRYVMMRPQEHELSLPARLFRWRGLEGGEVTTFRIAREYATREVTEAHIRAATDQLPPGVSHTMAFIGVGDHGGGPTERQIAWCRDHAEAFDGCRLKFSSPGRFFDAVEAEGAALPLVEGELQHHAVGCYSVMRAIKLGLRDAEDALGQAEILAAADPAPEADTAARLEAAWLEVAFNQFHDTLGGTCIPSAYPIAEAQLGGARATADDILQRGMRRLLARLPGDAMQRIAFFNAADDPYDGYVAFAPWTEARWQRHWRFLDEAGAVVTHQALGQEAATAFPRRVLLRLTIPAGSMRVLRLDRGGAAESASRAIAPPQSYDRLKLDGPAIVFAPEPTLRLSGLAVLTPRLELLDDPTDTWSHGVDRLGVGDAVLARWDPPLFIDEGPLMRSALQSGRIGDSELSTEWRVYAGESLVELRLRVDWRARRKLLKLTLPWAATDRVDGVMGGAMARALDGKERPLQGFVSMQGGAGALGVVCPDVFGLDADRDGARSHVAAQPVDGAPRSRAGRGVSQGR